MRNEKDVQRYLNINSFTQQDIYQTESWIQKQIKTKKIVLFIYSDDQLAGYIFIADHDLGESLKKGCEIGFAIHKSCWHKGFMSKLFNKSLILMHELDFKFIVARVLSNNFACIKFLEKSNFFKVATFIDVIEGEGNLLFYQRNIESE